MTYTYSDESDPSEDQMLDDGEISSTEEAFMKGYNNEGDSEECEECGSSLSDVTPIIKEVDGEAHKFCTKVCADEFEEGLGDN